MYFGGRFAALNPSPPWCGCACTCKRACAPDMAQIDFSIRRAYGFLSEGGANPVRRRGPRGVFCFEMQLLANDSPAIWPRLYASTCLGAGHGEWLWPRPPVPRVSGRPGQAFGMCGLFRPVALHQTHQSQGGCSSSHASFASVSVARMSVWDTRSAGTSF